MGCSKASYNASVRSGRKFFTDFVPCVRNETFSKHRHKFKNLRIALSMRDCAPRSRHAGLPCQEPRRFLAQVPKMRILRTAVGLAFAAAGIAHLRSPASFAHIVPPGFGDPMTDAVLSGVAEICGGIGLLIPATRRFAGIGLLVLLAAVWPANWYMALTAPKFRMLAPAWVLWLRVPLQLPFAYAVWRALRES